MRFLQGMHALSTALRFLGFTIFDESVFAVLFASGFGRRYLRNISSLEGLELLVKAAWTKVLWLVEDNLWTILPK